MRWSAIVLAALSACSPGHVPDDDNASSAPATDAGVASIDAGFAATDAGAPSIDAGSIFTDVPGADAGVTPANGGPATADAGAAGTDAGTARIDAGTIAACDDGTGDGTLELDAGPPPDGGSIYSTGPTPGADRQSATWASTGAAGCEGLVPASVSPRLSWTASAPPCAGPWVDGEGDVAFTFDIGPFEVGGSQFSSAYFPADGSAGLLVTRDEGIFGVRSQGFYRRIYPWPSTSAHTTEWFSAIGPDGSDQGLVRTDDSTSEYGYSLLPDPRGGYVESHIRLDNCNLIDNFFPTPSFELRWVDAGLSPRTPWWRVTSWSYVNFNATVFVDAQGRALVAAQETPPMSMGLCDETTTIFFWVSEGGSVVPFTPVLPTYHTDQCTNPQPRGFGTALPVDGGGLAFYVPRDPALSTSGWYAFYASGSGTSAAPPSWLSNHATPAFSDCVYGGCKRPALRRLANGAYLDTQREPVSCSRTAEIVGPAGQVCATLVLDGSGDCTAEDGISPDGTLVLHEPGSCTLVWWPGLGHSF